MSEDKLERVKKWIKDVRDALVMLDGEHVIDASPETYWNGWIMALTWVLDRVLEKIGDLE
jgi:hypothetical protein